MNAKCKWALQLRAFFDRYVIFMLHYATWSLKHIQTLTWRYKNLKHQRRKITYCKERKREWVCEREREMEMLLVSGRLLKETEFLIWVLWKTRNKFSYHYVNHLIHVGFVIIHAIQRKRFVHTKYVISDKLNRKEWSSLYQSIIP